MRRQLRVWVLLFGLTNAHAVMASDAPTQINPSVQVNASPPVIVDITPPVSNSQPAFADDPVGYFLHPFMLSSRPAMKHSIFVFGGRMSETDIWSTASFNLTRTTSRIHYDNNIAGIAYQRDLVELNGGLKYGFEAGIADRFGHYLACCTTIVYSSALINSLEVWGGVTMRYQAVNLFNVAYLSPGVVFGLSYVGNPIGQENIHQLPGGSTKLLFYVAFEGALSFPSLPDTEFVLRLHHRSGAFGTLGAMREGNNANVIGVRQRF